jgi:hypothetical protein
VFMAIFSKAKKCFSIPFIKVGKLWPSSQVCQCLYIYIYVLSMVVHIANGSAE